MMMMDGESKPTLPFPTRLDKRTIIVVCLDKTHSFLTGCVRLNLDSDGSLVLTADRDDHVRQALKEPPTKASQALDE